jgi:hypothetical protein
MLEIVEVGIRISQLGGRLSKEMSLLFFLLFVSTSLKGQRAIVE